jgi:hypothetical protein
MSQFATHRPAEELDTLRPLRCCQQRGAEIRAVLVLHREIQPEPRAEQLATLSDSATSRAMVLNDPDHGSLLRPGCRRTLLSEDGRHHPRPAFSWTYQSASVVPACSRCAATWARRLSMASRISS